LSLVILASGLAAFLGLQLLTAASGSFGALFSGLGGLLFLTLRQSLLRPAVAYLTGFGLFLTFFLVLSPGLRDMWLRSIRWKFVLAFVASALAALAGEQVVLLVAYALRRMPLFGDLLHALKDGVGTLPVALVTGLGLFLVLFFLLSRGTVRQIEELNEAVNQIARGRFEVQVPERTQDELGQLAHNLTLMSRQLKTSIEQERDAARAKNELITSVSHDLRTPLTSVLGYLDLIDGDHYVDEVELRHYVAIAHAKGRQLKRLVDQLFEYTRTSSGGIGARLTTVNLGELMEQLAEEFVPALLSAGMHYRLVVPADKVSAAVDPDLMVRVLENLISNAIRYGGDGRQVDLELSLDGDQRVLKVANHGPRIPEADLPHLFETFYRVEKSRSAETGGAGLGLAIAKNIIDLHHGTITAYNEPNRTVFEIRLPGPPVGA
jgi:signal transduction histidine kinase